MKHIKEISMPPKADGWTKSTDWNSVFWIIVNFVNAGLDLGFIFSMVFDTVSNNIISKTES